MIDSDWLTKELLEKKILETIKDEQYEEFVAVMQRLLQHPYSYECKDFIMENRRNLVVTQKGREIIEPKIGADGRKYVTTCGNCHDSKSTNLETIVAYFYSIDSFFCFCYLYCRVPIQVGYSRCYRHFARFVFFIIFS